MDVLHNMNAAHAARGMDTFAVKYFEMQSAEHAHGVCAWTLD